MAAACARVAVPCGARVSAVIPVMIPFPPGLAQSNVQLNYDLLLLREKTLQNGSYLSSRRSPPAVEGDL